MAPPPDGTSRFQYPQVSYEHGQKNSNDIELKSCLYINGYIKYKFECEMINNMATPKKQNLFSLQLVSWPRYGVNWIQVFLNFKKNLGYVNVFDIVIKFDLMS